MKAEIRGRQKDGGGLSENEKKAAYDLTMIGTKVVSGLLVVPAMVMGMGKGS